MPILDAALAFALTMLVVATAVTQIVRLLQHLAGLRASEFQAMLNDFYAGELEPVVKRELERLKVGATDKLRSEILEAAANVCKAKPLFDAGELKRLVGASTEEIIERLKRSQLGDVLLRELGAEAQTVFRELGQRYEVVGARFTESFRRHSRWWATGIALGLALVINIDSVNVATSYIRNENLRDGVIARVEAITAEYDARVTSLDSADEASGRAALDAAIQGTREQIDFLRDAGFPIGWSYFPHAHLFGEPMAALQNRNTFGGWLLWIAGVLLTGVLAGLGAPFWYDAVTGIARVAQRARAGK